jgi:beta-galactosidase/beta-glucuronidase
MSQQKRRDTFAEIAGPQGQPSLPQPEARRREALVAPQPPSLPEKLLPLTGLDTTAIFQPSDKLDTPEKLARELERLRERYAPYMENLAPEAVPTRITVPLKTFDWRVETDTDQANFGRVLSGDGEWEEVHIPHYGGPLGRATTFYRTTVRVTGEMLALGSVFLCCQGVDYKAHAFVNGRYIGSHEGFFAPFEFECTHVLHAGENQLLLQVQNDAIFMGNDSWDEDGDLYEGDKLYAATGPGYDDPVVGWHHCPPGMGIYQNVTLEARTTLFIRDIFVRPLPEQARAEAWIEIYNTGRLRQEIEIALSLYGQNFSATVFEEQLYELVGPAGPTVNAYRLPFEIPDPRLWETEAPWLYQLQVRLIDGDGKTLDVQSRQFGMRSFRMEEAAEPKGRYYLNGHELPLRGANTMGHMQQCVIRSDWEQLRDDILLAKLCNMNFFRLTQRPVQPEIYDYCDRLGMMTQTDLPLFGVLRRNQFSEAVRQAGEMERLVRHHPCNVVISYINEPFPDAQGKPHRHLLRHELEAFFLAADQVVHLENPDRVIKPVDGDYDPPAPGLPDNHCYCGWYNGHGVDLGKLHKGYWQPVKPGWVYGCGEFGAEGLDPVRVMRAHYPPAWLPRTPEEEHAWTPDRIVQAQTGRFHYMWFDTQHSVANWVTASQAHQARMTRLMTEAFRRDSHMTSFAIHLFIDAFPSGWMKAIMDVERQPKPAYFAYREALTPLMANLRTDRTTFFAGEAVTVEAWVCNDRDSCPEQVELGCQLEMNGEVLAAQRSPADVTPCGSSFQGLVHFHAPQVAARSEMTLRLALMTKEGTVLHDTAITLEVFPTPKEPVTRVCVIAGAGSAAARLADELGVQRVALEDVGPGDMILAGGVERLDEIGARVAQGATALFLDLPPGRYEIAGDPVDVVPCGMNARHFCSRATGHPLVAGLQPHDLAFWYDAAAGHITPLLATTLTAPGWTEILASGNGNWAGQWGPAPAAVEKAYGQGRYRICQLSLADRTIHNPVAHLLARRLLEPAQGR